MIFSQLLTHISGPTAHTDQPQHRSLKTPNIIQYIALCVPPVSKLEIRYKIHCLIYCTLPNNADLRVITVTVVAKWSYARICPCATTLTLNT